MTPISKSPNTLFDCNTDTEKMEKDDQPTTISDTVATMDTSSPRFHGEPKPLSPLPEDSPPESSASSDRTSLSHGFSPKEEKYSATPPETAPQNVPEKPQSPVVVVSRSVRDESMVVTKVDPGAEAGFTAAGGGGSGRRSRPPTLSILRKSKRESMVKKVGLGFRVCGLVLCLVSFSVMASDKNKGWTLDSFDRYKEFRYCLSVNVIGFVYSGLQACGVAYHLISGKQVFRHPVRHYFDFFMDQILTYLLMSASSSAATRVDDWQSNWGKDKFPDMARASVGMSFLAFVALASSSLISGYTLCTFKSM